MKDAMCLMLLACVLSAVCDGADPVDVSGLPEGVERVEIFLLMGQSNMRGRGELPTSQTPHPRILNMNMADDHWYPAEHPLHKAGIPGLIDGSDNAGVGPGLDFAHDLIERDDKVLIVLVPCARGGSWIDLWGDGEELYENAVRRAGKALADFPEGKARVAGALWLQGESDSLEDRFAVYSDKLTDLIDRLRTDLNEPELPFVACTIGTFIRSDDGFLHVAEINATLLSLPERVPNTACVDARDLEDGHIGDFLHYNTEAQEIIGKRYAAEYLRLIGE